MKDFPTKEQLIQIFLSYSNWEERYMYIMDLGDALPKFPQVLRTNKYLVTGCQSYTWIALMQDSTIDNKKKDLIKFYGDSDAAIIKGIIVIIFSVYQNLDVKSIINFNINSFLKQLNLIQHLTMSRAQGIHSILNSIYMQINKL